jgi:hypothetical protein
MAAHDAAISSNPVRIAGRALNANYTAVSTGDVADLVTTLVGALVTKPFSIPDADWTAVVGSITNTTTAVTIKAAAGAGIRNYLTALTISHDLLGAGTLLSIRDGAGGSIIWRTRLQTPAAEDFQILFPTPLRSTANNLLEILTETAVTGSVFVSAQGYAAP